MYVAVVKHIISSDKQKNELLIVPISFKKLPVFQLSYQVSKFEVNEKSQKSTHK